ncbi:15585_t:CDS:2 [Funneliformis caledonium]|uniref:15585_t:CDS:1 n=1 Tax=Funneliformis caledonium TaxID=1117310 RepID=A0A9N9FMC0_9GLOM|nr:15585_t:CDS:2 [Funneliformis caledonium]
MNLHISKLYTEREKEELDYLVQMMEWMIRDVLGILTREIRHFTGILSKSQLLALNYLDS